MSSVVPLAIPTSDGDPSVTHPTLVDAGTAWNGYRYWMAYTPYPGADRENPSIVASSDLETWVVPEGLTNPVMTASQAQADGYLWNSDAELVLLADRSALWMYHRAYEDGATPSERIYRHTSVDGSTWSARQTCFSGTGTATAMLSPAVVQEADGSFSMWTVNRGAASVEAMIERRTSAAGDGLIWSSPAPCSLPLNHDYNPWHISVVLRGGAYYMLLNQQGTAGGELLSLRSADGDTWSGYGNVREVNLSATDLFDGSGLHYRSSFIPAGSETPVDTEFLLWDVIVAGLPSNYRSSSGDGDTKNDWLLGLYRGVCLRVPPI